MVGLTAVVHAARYLGALDISPGLEAIIIAGNHRDLSCVSRQVEIRAMSENEVARSKRVDRLGLIDRPHLGRTDTHARHCHDNHRVKR